ncbi:MAG: ATP synthase F1 subunit delta [Lachnospiraceae bacterium]|nr:ATP synthase F1 subunit delta [Lachnospiraceae bacterium]
MAKLVSKTYGDALFELALEEDKLDILFEESKVIKEVFLENNELLKLLNHPKIDKEEKIKVIENIFTERASKDFVGFLTVIIKKERQNAIIEILDYFINTVKEYKKIGVAYVTTAVELSMEKQKEVEKRLLDTTAYESFEMNYNVDKDIIGGMIIRIGDRVVDSSIRSKLNELSRELYNIQLV